MAALLLQTKLFIPPARPERVLRPRLTERLNAGLHRKLTLLSAPAGYGKTSLLSEWIHLVGTRHCGHPTEGDAPQVAWLSLDENDNDPTRFLTYLIAALRTLESSLAQEALGALQSPQTPPVETVLTALINELAAAAGPIVLVLDDYHLIEAQAVHDVLAFLLRHLPPYVHLVVATREDPLLPLAGLRARGQLTELRAADLRFTSAEAAEFLNRAMGLQLSPDDIAALEGRTEGWIAGLQLAAVSMKGRADTTAFIGSFTGSHHFVLDYLLEEVLHRQPEGLQRFLLHTAILDRLTGPLCDALTDQDNGQETLERLERANLFIVPLDSERRWYRYHHLFADLLRRRLLSSPPSIADALQGAGKEGELVALLHIRASEWYERNAFAEEATEHALRSGDYERAARLVEVHLDTLWQRGEHARLRRWLTALPGDLLSSMPQLCIFHAWYLFSSGRYDLGERMLRVAEEALERVAGTTRLHRGNVESDAERSKLRGRAATVRALMASYRQDTPGIIQHARRALDYLPEQDVTMRSAAAIALGNAYGFRGEMAAAYQARMEAVEASRWGGNTYFSVLAHLEVAITLREQGSLRQTIELCQQQVQLADESGLAQASVTGCLLAIWGEALAEQGDLEGARRQTERGVERAERGDLAMLGWSYMCLIRVLFSEGDLASVQELVHRVERTARESDVPPWITNWTAAWQARLWLAQGELEAPSQWAHRRGLIVGTELTLPKELDYFTLIECVILARILIAREQLEEAAGLLQRLLEAAEAGSRTSRVIEILALQALAHQATGDITQAVATLQRALALAEPEGFVRTFLDEGPPMARLLYEALSRGAAADYARRLLSAFPVAETHQAESLERETAEPDLIEPLSERELEVLGLIAQGLTNPEIASRLFLSLNTVKAHTRNIYGKLGVHNRTQAVARARALGVMPST